MYDWIKTASGETSFYVEIYGQFLLKDDETGELSLSRGFRAYTEDELKELEPEPEAAVFRQIGDFGFTIDEPSDCRELALGLIDGSRTAHFERIFGGSSKRSIVSVPRLTLCIDHFTAARWMDKYKAGQIHEARGRP